MSAPEQANEAADGQSRLTAELDEGRLIIEVFDADGVCVERSVGPSNAELKAAHGAGECGAWCAHCYTEACYQLEHGEVSNAK